MGTDVRAAAPGRVNLIGDHTDHSGGLVLPMAIDLGTTVEGRREGDVVRLTSDDQEGEALIPLDVDEAAAVSPPWARYVAGVVSVLRPSEGFTGRVATSLPVGAGLASSAALEVAVALALGFDGGSTELALAKRMIRLSDNDATTSLFAKLGKASAINKCNQRLGLTRTEYTESTLRKTLREF